MEREQEDQRLQELGDFLRTRRARLAPEAVGLPRGSRRRAPGLRRAEVAQLAGVSVDWYTWLEQGRPISVSTQVLESLVKALHLNTYEREHLFFLAHQQPPPARGMEPETVSATLQHFLDHQGLSPAFVSGWRSDVIAWNEAARVVFGDFGQMSSLERNSVWRLFTSPSHRQGLVDWEGHARKILAQFRAACGRYPDDPRLRELIHDLMLRSAEFRAWWPDHEVANAPEGQKTLKHPRVGYLMFEHITFQVFDAPDLKVHIHTPLDQVDTPAKIAQLLTQGASVSTGF
ncbi:XRE family transcriptional regulator [Ktedonosporobacter rubrisoli]|uniref:XRE family transcriptional regulator n=1 Tax=Ktedonosporobacter rubrisoli TaxID=2509675 RepID=A0A4P6JJH1_KTERU|nr:helix-turn-helix transcriptional regulator [Ktedonosporobacter rubrisoli]QBD75249.1 XRE family transcriptional regulator [Ktedonosporobacter rubrisoli]